MNENLFKNLLNSIKSLFSKISYNLKNTYSTFMDENDADNQNSFKVALENSEDISINSSSVLEKSFQKFDNISIDKFVKNINLRQVTDKSESKNAGHISKPIYRSNPILDKPTSSTRSKNEGRGIDE